jgi:hypothetical protein
MRTVVAVLALIAFSAAVVKASESIYLTVAYCPTDFTGKGAVVKVDPASGAWNIVGVFNWPDEIFGCPIEYDPTVTVDHDSGKLYLDFTDDFGLVITLDILKAKVVMKVAPRDPFFVGFVNMAYSQGRGLIGLAPHVDEEGFCDDGCFQIGWLNPVSGTYHGLADVPFKAMMDDSHFLDKTGNVFWVQGSYDLRDTHCGPEDSSECLLAIDSNTGKLINATYTPDYTVYKYAQAINSGQINTWVFGFDSTCQDPYNDFAFASVSLGSASATLQKCITHNATVDEDEWIASFNADDSLLATGSGDAETGIPQLLVFDINTGKAAVNTNLPGLAKALHAAEGLFAIWSVDFL